MLGKQPEGLVWLVLTVLAVWRVTALIAYESGPFHVLEGLRRVLVRLGLARLVGCFYCLSIWTSCGALLVFEPGPGSPVLVLGVAGAVSILERFMSGDRTTVGETHDD